MGHLDGMVPIVDYTGVSTAGEAIDLLLAELGDPDALKTEGRSGGSNFDEMSPVARAQLVAELEAMKAEIDLFEAGA